MKKVYLFFLLALELSGCGMKGDLYFSDKPTISKDSMAILSTVNDNISVTAKPKHFDQLYIEGSLAYNLNNNISGWQTVLGDYFEESSKSHYVLFPKGLVNTDGYQMIIGTPINKNKKGDLGVILSGNYMVFESKSNDLRHLPDMITAINTHFEQDVSYQRENRSDFMIIKNAMVKVYIKVIPREIPTKK